MAQTKIWDGTKWVDYIMSSQIKLPLGSIGFSLDGILPEGAIAATGLELSREVYKDLWGFAQKGGETRLISEEAWQAELAANEGRFCRYYSTGNGATTFRIPYIACYLSGTAEAEKVGTYVTDTQRNITGEFVIDYASSPYTKGAFYAGNTTQTKYFNSGGETDAILNFDASRSVGAEHTGEEVKLKTAYVLYYIQAFSTIINSGTLDINDLVGDVSDLTLNHQIKSFTDLTQIGLTNGIEQFQDIGKNLPENSQITYRVWEKDNHNHVIYPSTNGIFTMEKAITFCRCFYNSITPNKQWQMAFDYRDEFYIEPTWELLAKNNKLSMPSNNKIIINLKNQGDSWTAPCDGYIWGMKIGGSEVVNSWLNVWDSANADTTNYGTLIYCDYGQPYINLCGNLAVRKGQTVYFNWSNDCRVYFYPALNANSSVYGEDVRIYIQVVNSQGIVRGATVNISIGSEYTETGKTLADGRYLLSYAGYNVLKTAESLNVEVTCADGTTGQTQVPVGYFEDKINELQVLVS
jgi:hypothetical protein